MEEGVWRIAPVLWKPLPTPVEALRRAQSAPGGVGCSGARSAIAEEVLMVLLIALPPRGGGVFWQITNPRDPDVLTIAVPRAFAEDATVGEISRSQATHQEPWTLDLDALKARTDPGTVGAFPSWASGQLNVRPTQAGAPRPTFEITPEMLR
jgi:hypothetical protein